MRDYDGRMVLIERYVHGGASEAGRVDDKVTSLAPMISLDHAFIEANVYLKHY